MKTLWFRCVVLALSGACALLLVSCVPRLHKRSCTVDVYGQSQCSDVEMD